MNSLFQWLDGRTGFVSAFRSVFGWKVPRTRCCAGFLPVAIVFSFLLQGLTGLFLWAFYSPSAQTAWESVFHIQYSVPGGWLVRGIHHYSAQLLVGMLGIYVLLMIIRGTYRRPREFVYWSAMVLFLFSLASCLTGDLLSWTMSGYSATQTRVAFLQLLPVVGGPLYKLVVGGPDAQFGTLTLTRFLVLHIAVFGGGGFGVLLFWKYFDIRSRNVVLGDTNNANCALGSITAVDCPSRVSYWNCEILKNALTCWIVLIAILLLVCQHEFKNFDGIKSALTGTPSIGTELGAGLMSPADPAGSYDAARPEWSFRALYTWSKLSIFSKIGALYAIFISPAILFCYFCFLPILARVRFFHRLNIAVVCILFGFFCWGTYLSYHEDSISDEYKKGAAEGERMQKRALELASAPSGIPKEGALTLMQDDPFLQGPILFEQHCAICHPFTPFNGQKELPDFKSIACSEPSAPNLYQSVSRDWMAGFSDEKQLLSDNYFGKTKFAKDGSMIKTIRNIYFGGMTTKDGEFIFNDNNSLIYLAIAPDSSPAYDILESCFDEYFLNEENAETLENLDDEETAAKYIASLKDTVQQKFDDPEAVAEWNADWELPVHVVDALKTVLLTMFDDELFTDLLKDSDNIATITDEESSGTFLTDTYLYELCGESGVPKTEEDQKYIKILRKAIFKTVEEMGDVLFAESQLTAPRTQTDGKFDGLAENAIADMKYLTCTECHAFYGTERDLACDLRMYMSKPWIQGIISNPSDVKYYGKKNDRMIAYCPEEGEQTLSARQVEMIAQWMHADWYRPEELAKTPAQQENTASSPSKPVIAPENPVINSSTEPVAEEPAAPETPSTEPEAEEPAAQETPSTEPAAEEPAAPETPSTESGTEEPAAPETPSTEPTAEEPTVPETPSTEPAAEEPAAPETPSTEPAAKEPPVPEMPVDPASVPPEEETISDIPTLVDPIPNPEPEAPLPSDPIPSVDPPIAPVSTDEPATVEPAVEEPKAEEPVSPEVPVVEEPKAEEPVSPEEPAVEEPKVEEPVSPEVPAVEEPKVEEPVSPEVPVVEEPKAEEPKAEEPVSPEVPAVEEPETV